MIKLSVENLRLAYGGITVLHDVSLTLERGKILVLLGPSGSGKTTLLRAIAGFETPYEGIIRIEDRVVFDGAAKLDVPAEDRNLGLVFQSYALWPHRTVFDNVAYPLKLRGVAKTEIAGRVEVALSGLGLGHLAARYPHELSGGQQQRVAIARALVYNPPVILLDEPLSNLDAKLRDEARAWLRSLIVEMNLSVIMVTHDQDEAMALADDIILLSGGCIEQRGAPQDIYANPASLLSAEFFGRNLRIDGIAAHGQDGIAIETAGATLSGHAKERLDAGQPVTAVIRLEHIALTDGPGVDRYQATLTSSMFSGDRWRHIFRAGELSLQCYGPTPLSRGEYWIHVPAEQLWIFAQAD